MARRYAIIGAQDAGAGVTILGLTSATTIRPTIYDILIGSPAIPADNAVLIQARRYTAAGTATNVVPVALDPSDPASLATAGENHTVEPTYTAGAVLLQIPLNQQATARWVVPEENGLVLPASSTNGIGLQIVSVSGGAAEFDANAFFAE